jgi:hypothetical protein
MGGFVSAIVMFAFHFELEARHDRRRTLEYDRIGDRVNADLRRNREPA